MKNIHESVSKLLTHRLEKYKSKNLNDETCTLIYQEIFDSFVDLFQESKIEISNEAMNLLAQMYYDAVKINSTEDLNPNIFDKKASVKNVNTKELAMLGTMLSGTPFAEPMIFEVKRRS